MRFLPYGRQQIDDDDIQAVVDVLRSDWLTTGPAVERFEAALSTHAGGVPVVAVSSGTAALHAAYHAAGVGPGRTIVTSPLTFAATATAALALGAEVAFADVTDDTLTIDPAGVAALVSDRTAAVVPVDFAGHPAQVDSLKEIAGEVGALVVEDAAHSLGARIGDRPVGCVADLTTFSFHPVKHVTTGEGGAVAVADPAFLEEVRRFRSHGLVRDPQAMRAPEEGGWHQEVHGMGLNYRLPDVLAALGTSQLDKLDRFVKRRQELVDRYLDGLGDVKGLRLPRALEGYTPAWHLFAVRVLDGRRRALFDALRASGIGVQVHYLPVHLHPMYADLGFRAGMCPVAETAYSELLSLPLFPGMADHDADLVIDRVRDVLG